MKHFVSLALVPPFPVGTLPAAPRLAPRQAGGWGLGLTRQISRIVNVHQWYAEYAAYTEKVVLAIFSVTLIKSRSYHEFVQTSYMLHTEFPPVILRMRADHFSKAGPPIASTDRSMRQSRCRNSLLLFEYAGFPDQHINHSYSRRIGE